MLKDAMSFSDRTDVHIRRLEARTPSKAAIYGLTAYSAHTEHQTL